MPSPDKETAPSTLPAGAVARDVERHRGANVARVRDAVAEEIPIAFVYNERPHAVMMATPADLQDFALGFSLSEAIIDHAAQCEKVEIVEALAGIELRITIPEKYAAVLDDRVRQLTGRTGCGLCGAQTLDAAVRHPARVVDVATIDALALKRSLNELQRSQKINAVTGATHAAAWAATQGRIVLLREDVGRHNALDKLIGAMLSTGTDSGGIDPHDGFLVVTSRASYEMVMKAATVGIGFLAAISAPTALAIALAKETNLTLIGFARAHGYSVYANAQRVLDQSAQIDRSIAS
ncbi:MAG TPA: formate dehydrogenase accessory sulfurtransferase FdhD [Rudaea sp.]|jgi:FdhD protein|uniref:formate dehydrogenase accessory sulfurtransferase FdhD n=1 Tax=Rudaea sp. TaxID=2136325 RepID=UPI002F9345CB